LFMGNEFGSTQEWNHKTELPWELLQYDCHRLLKDCVRDVLHLVKREPAFYEIQFDSDCFEWVEINRRAECVMAFRRRAKKEKDDVIVVFNMTPVVRHDFPIYATGKKLWKEIFNSDSKAYWGTGDVFNPDIPCTLVDKESKRYELKLHLPALGAIVLK